MGGGPTGKGGKKVAEKKQNLNTLRKFNEKNMGGLALDPEKEGNLSDWR